MSSKQTLIVYLVFAIFSIFIDENGAKTVRKTTKCGYESCPPTKDGFLNVHLVPHTHDDVGWLKTVDQYYYGSAKDITDVGVQYILDSVIPELVKDPTKRFIYVEVAFFWRWWREQNEEMKQQVRELVNEGRLEFINGGWCMNDEAATHYNAIIDQMTWGFRRLEDEFGECGRPRIAWQIDPFGHSREQANLFAEMGFDGLFFGRLDYADKEKRLREKTMEMVWKGRDNDQSKSSWLFTGALYNGYGPPDGFCFDETIRGSILFFDYRFCADDPIMDDPRMHDYNVDKKVDMFIKAAREQASQYKTSHIFWTMGSDFHYTNANVNFKNTDKIMKYVNDRWQNPHKYNISTDEEQLPPINALYSTPSCYLKALNDDKSQSWPTKSDDFFPYASDPHAFWTGYFTSRPSLKGMVRKGNNVLQICKQLAAVKNLNDEETIEDLTVMREAMGVLQHHDAVSGTAKQAVTFDYAQRLHAGFLSCENVISKAVQKEFDSVLDQNFQFCHLLNISQCHVTEESDKFVVSIYNPLPREISRPIRLPVKSGSYSVSKLGEENSTVQSQLIKLPRSILLIPGRRSHATHELVFIAAKIPSMGTQMYHIEKQSGRINKRQMSKSFVAYNDFEIGFGKGARVVFDKHGKIQRVQSSSSGLYDELNQDFGWYEGHAGHNLWPTDRASGAYIFRPTAQSPQFFNDSRTYAEVFKGPIVHEVHQYTEPGWVNQVIRVYPTDPDVEFEWLVGPIPISDGIGKEIITTYTSPSLDTKDTFYTDSNGRQMIERVKDVRPTWQLDKTEPVSENYYPVNSRIAATSNINGEFRQVSVLTDRSQGGTSMKNGQLELMIHRRLLYDDAFGVGEALNETAYGQGLVVRGKHWLQFSNDKTMAARRHRLKSQQIFMDVLLSFAPTKMSFQEYKILSDSRPDLFRFESTFMREELPENVHILTLEPWRENKILLRLEHQFDVDEDPNLSLPVKINIKKLFNPGTVPFTIKGINEVALGANLPENKLQDRLKWNIEDNELPSFSEDASDNFPQTQSANVDTILLNPMQIRSFIIDIQPTN